MGQIIDFESVPGEVAPREGMEIRNQYLASQGISFELEGGGAPVLAEVGPPMTAFGGPGRRHADNPAPGQGVGRFFLTDDGTLNQVAKALIVRYASPTAAASGVLLDIDLTERFAIEAIRASSRDNYDTSGRPWNG
jgi:hypothetical protein